MAKKTINLGLQGGGAHGAYSWGVLDRLLEEKDLVIEGISGTSAGALNAAMLVQGFAKGGVAGAKETLEQFWWRISQLGQFVPWRRMPFEQCLSGWNMDTSPTYHWFEWLSRVYSPYDLNPLNINPIRMVIEEMLDFDSLQASPLIKLFVTATHVQSGQARVFHCNEITADVLMASTCIPFLFQAVEIEGEEYWDGGYMGNPAIWPLIYHCQSPDVALVQINPIRNEERPRSAGEIINRLNEITFNSSLVAEMRAIDFVSRLLHEGKLDRDRYKDMHIHLIYASELVHKLNASSKMNADWDFFQHLKAIGRQTAEQWLKDSWDKVGRESSVDIRAKFLSGPGKLLYAHPHDSALKQKPQPDKKQKMKQRK
jgi:NTE family protein